MERSLDAYTERELQRFDEGKKKHLCRLGKSTFEDGYEDLARVEEDIEAPKVAAMKKRKKGQTSSRR